MTEIPVHTDTSRLGEFPVTFFATVMGLAGLALALHAAAPRLGLPPLLAHVALAAAIADFIVIALIYAAKALRHPGAVRAEWHHPVKLAFFPAISISLLLIATALAPDAPAAARPIWILGAAGQAVLTLAVISGWIGHRPFQPTHISPAWFIPAVGNIVVPVAGVPLGFAELSWLFFAAGVIFWGVLLTLVMNRLIFHDPLPARLLPTLVILIAPPAVGFLAWIRLGGAATDPMARVFYYGALVFAGIVATQAPRIARLPFVLSWWALSFPVAALTIATFRYAALARVPQLDLLGAALLGLLAVLIAGLVLRTALAVARHEICVAE